MTCFNPKPQPLFVVSLGCSHTCHFCGFFFFFFLLSVSNSVRSFSSTSLRLAYFNYFFVVFSFLMWLCTCICAISILHHLFKPKNLCGLNLMWLGACVGINFSFFFSCVSRNCFNSSHTDLDSGEKNHVEMIALLLGSCKNKVFIVIQRCYLLFCFAAQWQQHFYWAAGEDAQLSVEFHSHIGLTSFTLCSTSLQCFTAFDFRVSCPVVLPE